MTVPRAMQLASDHEHTVRQASWYTKYGVVFTALLFLYTPTSSDPRRSPPTLAFIPSTTTMSSDEDEDDVAEVDAEEIDDDDDDDDDKNFGEAQAVAVVDAVVEDEDDDALEASIHYDDDDDEEEAMTIKSGMSGDSITGDAKPGSKKRKKPCPPPGRKARQPAVLGLTIPFRATKRAMKLDPDIGTVQNEAAILATLAAELFVKKLAKESQVIAKARGRNTIRYEDLAEARTKDSALGFLTTILP